MVLTFFFVLSPIFTEKRFRAARIITDFFFGNRKKPPKKKKKSHLRSTGLKKTTRQKPHRRSCYQAANVTNTPITTSTERNRHELGKRPTSPGGRNAPPLLPSQQPIVADAPPASFNRYCCSTAPLTARLPRIRYMSTSESRGSRSCSQQQRSQRCHARGVVQLTQSKKRAHNFGAGGATKTNGSIDMYKKGSTLAVGALGPRTPLQRPACFAEPCIVP